MPAFQQTLDLHIAGRHLPTLLVIYQNSQTSVYFHNTFSLIKINLQEGEHLLDLKFFKASQCNTNSL